MGVGNASPLLQNRSGLRRCGEIRIAGIEAFPTVHGLQNNPITHGVRSPALVRSKVTLELDDRHAVSRTEPEHIQAFERMKRSQRKGIIGFHILIEKLIFVSVAVEQNYTLKIRG